MLMVQLKPGGFDKLTPGKREREISFVVKENKSQLYFHTTSHFLYLGWICGKNKSYRGNL